MVKLFGSATQEPTKLELKNRLLARQAAREGFVLLKNENSCLPLKNSKIALYGMGARKTVKGGLGSGSVEERYSVTIEQGLENAGYTISSKKWLDDYDKEFNETYKEWHDFVEEQVAGITNPVELIPKAHSYVYRYPSGRLISDEDIILSDTDTAIYVIMRQAGECNDRKLEKGDYYLSDIEQENLKILSERYEKTILIVNVGGHIDFAFLDEIRGIDAVVHFVQGGEEGGNALADVLSGKYNFSGKLTDTIPMSYEDIPFGKEFSYLNGNLKDEDYNEGIFVGYRYYDSFDVPVRFPFGYGLSYTNFDLTVKEVQLVDSKVTIHINVTNTGKYSGKEVVQVYLAEPNSNQHKVFKKLVAFKKTDVIPPNETQVVKITFDMSESSYYDSKEAKWIIETGLYEVMVGNHSKKLQTIANIIVLNEIIVQECCNACLPTKELNELVVGNNISKTFSSNVPFHFYLSKESIQTKKLLPEKLFVESQRETELLDNLTDEEMLNLLCGGDLQSQDENAFEIPGAAGKTTTSLIEKGIPNILLADGPAGVNVISKTCFIESQKFLATEVPERYQWGVLGKMMSQQLSRLKGEMVYRYATAWPVEMLLAQTWNLDLLYEVGCAVGQELKAFGLSIWLAPGMNIHRNPLGGRNFEYYSEDPIVSGYMASALINGVQSNKGVGVCVKHFACNNSEDNRNGISANVGERALREIYLKGFEIAVKNSKPMAVMTSYNKINQVYTANSSDLIQKILRQEWQFDGLVMTDWGSTNEQAAQPEMCILSGNDLIMPGNSYDHARLKQAFSDGILDEKIVRLSAGRVLRLILSTKV